VAVSNVFTGQHRRGAFCGLRVSGFGAFAVHRRGLLLPAPPMDAAASRAILLEIRRRFTPIQLKFHPPPHEHSLRHRFIELIDRFTKDFIWFSKISPQF
jgi:hypothetical protein